eukprot:1126587-Amphidinium_carterae.1
MFVVWERICNAFSVASSSGARLAAGGCSDSNGGEDCFQPTVKPKSCCGDVALVLGPRYLAETGYILTAHTPNLMRGMKTRCRKIQGYKVKEIQPVKAHV